MQHARGFNPQKSNQASDTARKNDQESRPSPSNSDFNKSLSARRKISSLPPMQNSVMNATSAGSTLKIGRNSYDVLHSSPSSPASKASNSHSSPRQSQSQSLSQFQSQPQSLSRPSPTPKHQKSFNNSMVAGANNDRLKLSRNFTDPTIQHRNLGQDSIKSASSSNNFSENTSFKHFNRNNHDFENIRVNQSGAVSQLPVSLTVWFHELRTSSQDMIIDQSVIPGLKEGDVCEISPLRKENEALNTNSTNSPSMNPNASTSGLGVSSPNMSATTATIDNNELPGNTGTSLNTNPNAPLSSFPSLLSKNKEKKLYITVKKENLLSNLKDTTQSAAKLNFQLSLLSNPLQKVLDLLPRSLVQVRAITDRQSIEADTIEIFIRDVNLSRDSMWNFSSSLAKSCVYIDQRLSYLGNRTGVVKYIYKEGKKVFSAYIGDNTKFVYRSESAKLTFLVQLSREMWHFEENGEIMFHKLVNTLFPKIFKKWRDKNTHHSITIVLFTSMDLTNTPWTSLGHGERPNNRRDFFRVVVDQINIFHWDKIMASLRLEFANFKRDVMLTLGEYATSKTNSTENDLLDSALADHNQSNDNHYVMSGQQLPAVKGNVLEAVNLGLTLVTDRFRNTDLKHCLNHFVLITPGTGIFDVDYSLLLQTSKKMHSLDIALDLICLSQPPLHVVPLFRYKDSSQNGKLCHCVPTWCDISFYKDSSEFSSQWIPRCKIYELQMMGVMENNINDVSIDRLNIFTDPKSIVDSMDKYDDNIFKKLESKPREKKKNSNHPHAHPGNFKDGRSSHSKSRYLDSAGTLSLIKKSTADIASTAKVDVKTNESSVLGTVTNLNADVSALSSLYTLNKVTEEKPLKQARSDGSLRSFSPMSALKTIRSNFISDGASITSVNVPKLTSPPADKNISQNTVESHGTNNKQVAGKISKSKAKRKGCTNRKESHYRSKKRVIPSSSQTTENRGSHESKDLGERNFKTSNEFWSEIINPSKESQSDILGFLRASRWNDVFPAKIRKKQVNWRSFQSPAALPITTNIFPTKEQLEEGYTFQLYTLTLSWENSFGLQTNQSLMREMIELRLALGFQICYSDQVIEVDASRMAHGRSDRVIKYFPQDEESCIGARIYLSFDDEIHRICCESSENLNVQLYKRRKDGEDKEAAMFGYHDYEKEGGYRPLIRTRYADDYTPVHIDAMNDTPKKYNWNQFDQLLAGYDDAIPEENKEFHKMKFVVTPAEIPKNAFFISNERLTDEEIRVEGLRRLIATIERGKYEQSKEGQSRKKEEILPEISFYTGNLYDFLNDQAEVYDNTGNQPENSLLLPEGARYNKNIKLSQLAQELQSPGGVRLVDRTWHFKTHLHCFLGNELVSWIIECFEDIDNREDATEYGQSLMNRGLLKHVENRHGLLDGYYFYEFQEEYMDKNYKAEKSSWFSKKKTPSTSNMNGNLSEKPETLSKNNSDNESMKSPYLTAQDSDIRKVALSQSNAAGSEVSSMTDSSTKPKQKKNFILSRCVKFDADPLRKSFRPEIINVHYDRVHNPEHCYHIRLQWLNTTTKFVDDVIVGWSRLCERYGLKLVETPWKELCTIPKYNPFHSFVDLKLALNPWLDPEFQDPEILKDNKFYYHLFLLKESSFLLDNRSSIFFSKDHINISYSWGKPIFQYAQYIHETGAYIVELRDNGDFFLAPNNIHLIRLNTLLTSIHDHDSYIKNYTLDSQKIMLGFRAACNDVSILRAVFKRAKASWKKVVGQNVVPDI